MRSLGVAPSAEASAILAALRKRGSVGSAHDMARMPLPPAVWWAAVSRGARADEPYFKTAKELAALQAVDPRIPAWPSAMYEVEESLPAISREEAIALLALFFRLERRGISAGVQLYLLHWDVLAAQYCPLRERYRVIQELVVSGVLTQGSDGSLHSPSNARWPLHVSELGARAVRQARMASHLPTFVRLEAWLREVRDSFPILVSGVAWLMIGGGLVKLIDWLVP